MKVPNDPQNPLPVGTILDNRFELKALLGAGSFGQVYCASQIVFGRPLRQVALKLFFADAVGPHNVNEVFSDALTLLSLQEDHPNPEIARHLVQVYDMGLLDGDRRAFMSMRLVPGSRTLLDAVRRHRSRGMPVDLTLRFLRQILVPLAWMHTLDPPVVHGDLKPDNVLLTTDTELVLTDFGLAARLPLGTQGGALAYQAPETLLRLHGGTPSDIYSVGLIWYEMLTGQHPFADVGEDVDPTNDQPALIAAHRRARKWDVRPASQWDPLGDTERIVPAEEVNEELKRHPQLTLMLARCLRSSESERYANARQFLDDLDQYLKEGIASGALSERTIAQPEPAGQARNTQSLPVAKLADAEALRSQGRLAEALRIVEALPSAEATATRACVLKVRLQLALGQIEPARLTCAEALRNTPNSPDILEVAAEALEASNQPTMAETYRRRASVLRRQPPR